MKRIILPVLLAGALAASTGCAHKSGNAAVADIATPDTSTVVHPEWARNAVIYEVNIRQYTPEGTFAAFQNHIPRLLELGVDILWQMPVHPISQVTRTGTLGSYYAVADYKAVNPEFGTLDDFRALVGAVHEAGMKIILDWVPNHTGCDNAWVSEHPERYTRNDEGAMFGPYDWTDVYKLDYSKADTREAMIDALSFWLTDAGIDGYRCDVASEVPTSFWDEARPRLQAAAGRPIFMLAESSAPDLLLHAFDMDYNWPMKDLFSEIAATAGQYSFVAPGQESPREFKSRHAADIDSLLEYQCHVYPVGGIMMNMTSNHDLNSWEGTEFRRLGNLAPAFAVLSYTLPGMPLIYTGQETGMDRALEFFEKDSAPVWEPRNEYFDFYRRLNALKHSRAELAAGMKKINYRTYSTGSENLLLFTRSLGDAATIVGMNLGASEETLHTTADDAPDLTGAVDYATGEAVDALPSTLAPGQYFIYTVN